MISRATTCLFGFTDGTRKDDIRKPFSNFGKVTDVYFGSKKDYHRKNFAFVWYAGVVDANALEEKLQGIRGGIRVLSVNISKHPRKPILELGRDAQKTTAARATKLGSASGMRDRRTFAQALRGNRDRLPKSNSPPIVLNSKTYMKEWIKKSVLIGEAHSFDHIGTMHDSHIVNEETKYLGGLRLAIEFNNSSSAAQFLGYKIRWRDWFKWLIRADQHELKYERTAWLKILGIPLSPLQKLVPLGCFVPFHINPNNAFSFKSL